MEKSRRLRRRPRAGHEYDQRIATGKTAIQKYLTGSKFENLSIHETVTLLESIHGQVWAEKNLNALGIKKDRYGQHGEKGRFRIRRPDDPHYPGTWDNNKVLQAFIVGRANANNDKEAEDVVALVYQYLCLEYTPIYQLPVLPKKTTAKIVPLFPLLQKPEVAPTIPLVTEPEQQVIKPEPIFPKQKTKEVIPEPVAEEIISKPVAMDLFVEPEDEAKPIKISRPLKTIVAGLLVGPGLIIVFWLITLAVQMFSKPEIAWLENEISYKETGNENIFVQPRSKPKITIPKSPLPYLRYRLNANETISSVAHKYAKKSNALQLAKQIARLNNICVPEWGINRGTLDARRLSPGTKILIPIE